MHPKSHIKSGRNIQNLIFRIFSIKNLILLKIFYPYCSSSKHNVLALAISENPLTKMPNSPPLTALTLSSYDSFSSLPSLNDESNEKKNVDWYRTGKLKKIKQKEAALANLLSAVRQEKLATLRSRPLTIGVIGFGRFGQFIAKSFAKHAGRVVVTSRSDYTEIANSMGVKYVPLSDKKAFLDENLDVIVVATSILSFDDTVRDFVPYLKQKIGEDSCGIEAQGPLIVDVLSVKEHPRNLLLDLLPAQCDILCTHPMFGPDSGKNGWHGLTFVYERTRIHGAVLDPNTQSEASFHQLSHAERDPFSDQTSFLDDKGVRHTLQEDSEMYTEGMDRMERFLSIWEEEGCRMVPMSCRDHDEYAANSQFITHLMGRILGSQGLKRTPIDTKGFESVLKLIGTTTADSFDLFYGLYKYNSNSMDTILKLRESMENVITDLKAMEKSQDE